SGLGVWQFLPSDIHFSRELKGDTNCITSYIYDVDHSERFFRIADDDTLSWPSTEHQIAQPAN
ncbi:MAG: hypothetical protein WDZ79_02490, partial [Candidatus Paceibacterota bacterium]